MSQLPVTLAPGCLNTSSLLEYLHSYPPPPLPHTQSCFRDIWYLAPHKWTQWTWLWEAVVYLAHIVVYVYAGGCVCLNKSKSPSTRSISMKQKCPQGLQSSFPFLWCRQTLYKETAFLWLSGEVSLHSWVIVSPGEVLFQCLHLMWTCYSCLLFSFSQVDWLETPASSMHLRHVPPVPTSGVLFEHACFL